MTTSKKLSNVNCKTHKSNKNTNTNTKSHGKKNAPGNHTIHRLLRKSRIIVKSYKEITDNFKEITRYFKEITTAVGNYKES
jgi:seryl-tRNA synthetase